MSTALEKQPSKNWKTLVMVKSCIINQLKITIFQNFIADQFGRCQIALAYSRRQNKLIWQRLCRPALPFHAKP